MSAPDGRAMTSPRNGRHGGRPPARYLAIPAELPPGGFVRIAARASSKDAAIKLCPPGHQIRDCGGRWRRTDWIATQDAIGMPVIFDDLAG